MKQQRSDIWIAISKASTTGFSILGTMGLCMALGYICDSYLGIAPWGVLIGGLSGGFLGLYSAIRRLM